MVTDLAETRVGVPMDLSVTQISARPGRPVRNFSGSTVLLLTRNREGAAEIPASFIVATKRSRTTWLVVVSARPPSVQEEGPGPAWRGPIVGGVAEAVSGASRLVSHRARVGIRAGSAPA